MEKSRVLVGRLVGAGEATPRLSAPGAPAPAEAGAPGAPTPGFGFGAAGPPCREPVPVVDGDPLQAARPSAVRPATNTPTV
jgi:hypothetical protein